MENFIPPLTKNPYPVYVNNAYIAGGEQPMAVKSDLTVIHRGSDTLAVVPTKALAESANALNAVATSISSIPSMPNYTPGRAGAILIFHTEDGDFSLSGVRDNPSLVNAQTKSGASFPKEATAAISGPIADPALPLKESVMTAIKNRMFLNTEASQDEDELKARELLNDLWCTINRDDGWEDKVCIQAAKWTGPDATEGKTCYLTGVKHIRCSRSDLRRIEEALDKVEASQRIKAKAKEKSENLVENLCLGRDTSTPKSATPKAKFELEFVRFNAIIANSLDNTGEHELLTAYAGAEKFCAVILDDKAVTTLVNCDAFQHRQYADLVLPSYGVPWIDFANEAHHHDNAVAHTHGAPASPRHTESVGQQIARLQREYDIQDNFLQLAKDTFASIQRAPSNEEKKLIADDFIEACHDHLDESKDENTHGFIRDRANQILKQIDPEFRVLTTRIKFRFQKLVKNTLAAIKKAADELETKLIVDRFIVGCHQFLSETDDADEQSVIVKKAQTTLEQIDPTYLTLAPFTVNRLRLNNS